MQTSWSECMSPGNALNNSDPRFPLCGGSCRRLKGGARSACNTSCSEDSSLELCLINGRSPATSQILRHPLRWRHRRGRGRWSDTCRRARRTSQPDRADRTPHEARAFQFDCASATATAGGGSRLTISCSLALRPSAKRARNGWLRNSGASRKNATQPRSS